MRGDRFYILAASLSYQLASNKLVLLCLFIFNMNTCIMVATEWHVTSTYVSAVHRRLQMQQKSRRIQICLELCQSGKMTSCLVEEKLKCDCWQTNNCRTLSPKPDETRVEIQKRFFCNPDLSLLWKDPSLLISFMIVQFSVKRRWPVSVSN